jgi:hypothetical protein
MSPLRCIDLVLARGRGDDVEYDSQHAPTTQETEPWTKDWPGVSRRAPTSDSIAEAHVADEALGAARQWLARSSKSVSLGLRSGANPWRHRALSCRLTRTRDDGGMIVDGLDARPDGELGTGRSGCWVPGGRLLHVDLRAEPSARPRPDSRVRVRVLRWRSRRSACITCFGSRHGRSASISASRRTSSRASR